MHLQEGVYPYSKTCAKCFLHKNIFSSFEIIGADPMGTTPLLVAGEPSLGG